MCGIAGAIGATSEGVVRGMLARIRHRGPDATGFQLFPEIAFGNTRLSIIDLTGGNQPMVSNSGNEWVVLNGEIYGYLAIRDRIKRAGYSLKTHSDTEILLPLYQQHGLDLFTYLNGMFSFCLYDRKQEQLILARDPYGIKPLVYTRVKHTCYFSSEIKSFYAIPGWQAVADRDAWHTFLNIRFPPAPHTLFQGVSKVPPGCYILFQKNSGTLPIPASHQLVKTFSCGEWQAQIFRYYALPEKQFEGSFAEAVLGGNDILQKAVNDQLVADVPVGVYLSGGIDSSTVTAFASQMGKRAINTLCLGFGEPSDENSDALIIAKHFQTNHTDIVLDEQPLRYYRQAIYHMEEPKVNCLQGFILAREAAKHQKVVLSGLGGDELFGGYDIYEIGQFIDGLRTGATISMGKVLGALMKVVTALNPSLRWDLRRRQIELLRQLKDPLDIYLLLRNGWDTDKKLVRQIYRPKYFSGNVRPVREHFQATFPKSASIAEAFMRFEFQNKMVDDFLANEDRMSMAHSLEVRVPFLDKNLVEYGWQLPVDFKIKGKQKKIILRALLEKIMPKEILQKPKQGFTFNPVLQAEKDLQPLAKKYLTRERVEESGVFQYAYIRKIIESRPHPNLRWHYFLLWKIVGYHIWEEIFIHNHGQPRTD